MTAVHKPQREAWLDGLKGFAILLVVLGHVLSGYLDGGTFPQAYESFYPVRSWIYSFHMPLFFLISGYTFTLAYYPAGTLRRGAYLRQLGSLLWIYVVFALVQWVVKQAVPDMVNEVYTLEDLTHMFVTPLGNFWYLYVLFVIYVLCGAIGLPRRNPWWLLVFAGGAVAVAAWHLDWTYLTVYRIFYHLVFFAGGSFLCRRRRWLKNPHLWGICGMLLGTAAYFYVFWHIRSWYALWRVLIAGCTSFLAAGIFYRCPKLAELGLLQRCGRHCLEIYLLHTFFTAGFRTLLPWLGLGSPWGSVWVNFLLSTGICLGGAALADRFRWTDVIFRPARFFSRHGRRTK